MTARARGDHDRAYLHRWRPKQPGTSAPRRAPQLTTPRDPDHRPAPAGAVESHPPLPPPEGQSRTARRAIVFVVVALAAAGVASTRPRTAPPAMYPPSPRAWFDAYLAAAVDDPGRVCQTLFAPELAARYRHTPPGSCLAFFSDVQDSPVRIRRIVESGATAVIDARQTHPSLAWSVVLARHGGGWRAVDLISEH